MQDVTLCPTDIKCSKNIHIYINGTPRISIMMITMILNIQIS